MENEINPVLYILMRNDLPSMNAGKAMAQASHASNAFLHTAPDNDMVDMWTKQTDQGFGTVLVLAVNEREMYAAADMARNLGFTSGIVHDPTYPILVPHELGEAMAAVDNPDAFTVGEARNYVTIPLDTCAYVFGNKNNAILSAILGRFPLHP